MEGHSPTHTLPRAPPSWLPVLLTPRLRVLVPPASQPLKPGPCSDPAADARAWALSVSTSCCWAAPGLWPLGDREVKAPPGEPGLMTLGPWMTCCSRHQGEGTGAAAWGSGAHRGSRSKLRPHSSSKPCCQVRMILSVETEAQPAPALVWAGGTEWGCFVPRSGPSQRGLGTGSPKAWLPWPLCPATCLLLGLVGWHHLSREAAWAPGRAKCPCCAPDAAHVGFEGLHIRGAP